MQISMTAVTFACMNLFLGCDPPPRDDAQTDQTAAGRLDRLFDRRNTFPRGQGVLVLSHPRQPGWGVRRTLMPLRLAGGEAAETDVSTNRLITKQTWWC